MTARLHGWADANDCGLGSPSRSAFVSRRSQSPMLAAAAELSLITGRRLAMFDHANSDIR